MNLYAWRVLVGSLLGLFGAAFNDSGSDSSSVETQVAPASMPASSPASSPADPATDEPLRDELLAMAAEDRRVRAGAGPKMTTERLAAIGRVDAAHEARVRQIVAQRGWPGKSLVGSSGAHAVWLLVQHSDPAFQKECLPLLERAANCGEASKADYAWLLDHVRVFERESPLRGTQGSAFPDDETRVIPVDDTERIDRRRAEMASQPPSTAAKAIASEPSQSAPVGAGSS
ncbi:hypothetical protein DB347_03945 [Opitutaceae bacterium EW11]|nr:hypothetical protein DB347_03945 [Opitutaceae bacterium EW11]